MFVRGRQCNCMNNNYQNNCSESNNEIYETVNLSAYSQNMNCDYEDNCECGFDNYGFNPFPENPVLGQSYVPIQQMDKTFKPNVGLKMGTIFPELVMPYSPCQSMREIEYIAATNNVKEGCNKCQ